MLKFALHCPLLLWVISGSPAGVTGTSAVGARADVFRGKADIPLPMSGLGGKADSLA